MHASLNVGFQGKSGPGKIHVVILVEERKCISNTMRLKNKHSSYYFLRERST